jgi:hypothetical protein
MTVEELRRLASSLHRGDRLLDVEDLVAEGWLAEKRGEPAFRGMLDARRAARRGAGLPTRAGQPTRRAPLFDDLASPANDPVDALVAAEERAILRSRLVALPGRVRRAALAEKLKPTGWLMGISESRTCQLRTRAVEMLKRVPLCRYCGGPLPTRPGKPDLSGRRREFCKSTCRNLAWKASRARDQPRR